MDAKTFAKGKILQRTTDYLEEVSRLLYWLRIAMYLEEVFAETVMQNIFCKNICYPFENMRVEAQFQGSLEPPLGPFLGLSWERMILRSLYLLLLARHGVAALTPSRSLYAHHSLRFQTIRDSDVGTDSLNLMNQTCLRGNHMPRTY